MSSTKTMSMNEGKWNQSGFLAAKFERVLASVSEKTMIECDLSEIIFSSVNDTKKLCQ